MECIMFGFVVLLPCAASQPSLLLEPPGLGCVCVRKLSSPGVDLSGIRSDIQALCVPSSFLCHCSLCDSELPE
jgi:hypothetical protein